MRRTFLAFIVLTVGAASAARAQTTEDGIAALARGDVARAAEILKPIAESWPPRDRTAEFFMAALYENGLGVGPDPMRACALYARASRDDSTPFSRLAQELLLDHQRALGMDGFLTCLRISRLGFDHGFQATTFELEPGHWIAVDVEGATIAYGGAEKRVDLNLGPGGARFLPVQHTELRTGRSLSARRHFIEFFFWLPRDAGASWTLMWHVFEAVRSDLVSVTAAELATVADDHPPDVFDVRGIARLQVHESGYAEWSVLGGPDQRSGLIATDAEKQEIAGRKKAREAAEARVDWTNVKDVERPPSLVYADGDGCAYGWVYGWSSDRLEAITIRADRDLLDLSETPRTFDLATPPPGLDVSVRVYDTPVRSWPFCTDVVEPTSPQQRTWRAVGGTATIELTPPVVRADMPWAFRATVRINGLEVIGPSGARVVQPQTLTFTAIVGWVSG